MYENAQERPRTPGITDGVVELRKRRPAAPAGTPDPPKPGPRLGPAPTPAPAPEA
ncbi:hypothetical protein [Streptomyces sp. NPDC001594]|uniref:hypothetical protein n=1 Tax=Streptomyces sp. NPDC001594 TaxID=3364590 RepID=UPI0036C7C74B